MTSLRSPVLAASWRFARDLGPASLVMRVAVSGPATDRREFGDWRYGWSPCGAVARPTLPTAATDAHSCAAHNCSGLESRWPTVGTRGMCGPIPVPRSDHRWRGRAASNGDVRPVLLPGGTCAALLASRMYTSPACRPATTCTRDRPDASRHRRLLRASLCSVSPCFDQDGCSLVENSTSTRRRAVEPSGTSARGAGTGVRCIGGTTLQSRLRRPAPE